MKLLHTSDWHLGAADHNRSLLEDQRFFIEAICNLVKEQKIDAVLIAGDIFDRSIASAEAIRLYDEAMTRLCLELRVQVLSIAGNHDSAERLSSCGELLAASGLHIAGALEAPCRKVVFPDTEIYLLPWITEEKVKSVFPEQGDAVTSFEDAYRVTADAMRETFTEGKKHILLAHAFVTGSETSESDRAAAIGAAQQIPASVFEGFDYVALGHIHKPQNVTETIRYSGTPMIYSFGREETQEKSVTVLDTETMEQTVFPLPALHRRTTLSGTLDELLSPTFPEDIRTGYVSIRITDCAPGLGALSELKRVYPNMTELIGKTFEGETTSVNLTMDALERLEEDPVEVFRYFCRDEAGEEADEHLLSLFRRAVEKAEEEQA